MQYGDVVQQQQMNNFYPQQHQRQQVIGHTSMPPHGAPPNTMMPSYLYPNPATEQAYLMQQQAVAHNRGFIQPNPVGLPPSVQMNPSANNVGKQKTGRKSKKALAAAAASSSINPKDTMGISPSFQMPPHPAAVMHSQNPQMFNQTNRPYGNIYMPPAPSPQVSAAQQQLLQQQRWPPIDQSLAQANYSHSEHTQQLPPVNSSNMPPPNQPAHNFIGVQSNPQPQVVIYFFFFCNSKSILIFNLLI